MYCLKTNINANFSALKWNVVNLRHRCCFHIYEQIFLMTLGNVVNKWFQTDAKTLRMLYWTSFFPFQISSCALKLKYTKHIKSAWSTLMHFSIQLPCLSLFFVLSWDVCFIWALRNAFITTSVQLNIFRCSEMKVCSHRGIRQDKEKLEFLKP